MEGQEQKQAGEPKCQEDVSQFFGWMSEEK